MCVNPYPRFIIFGYAAFAFFVTFCPLSADASNEGFADPLRAWKTMDNAWDGDHWMDFATLEWEYFMIHDDDSEFVGVLGYILTDPRGKGLDAFKMIPSGGNVAVGGRVLGADAVGEYVNFPLEGTDVNATSKDSLFTDPHTDHYAAITTLPSGAPDGGDALRLQGRTELFEWDLRVYQAWTELNDLRHDDDAAFTVVSDEQVGYTPYEVFTIDAIWPRTAVVGTMTYLPTGEVMEIQGKGYRENSWGRYLMPTDGWDFLVYSDHGEEGTLMAMQTYHKSTQLDYLDVAFRDSGTLVSRRFRPTRGEMGWVHNDWRWDPKPRQCVPTSTEIVAEDDDYRLEAWVEIPPEAQEPFLSGAAFGTKVFFIQEQYPFVEGRILRRDTEEVVTTFSGQAGGEFALHKALRYWRPSWECHLWGRQKFSQDL